MAEETNETTETEGAATAVADSPSTETEAEGRESLVSLGPENLYEGMFLVDSGKFASDQEGMTARILEVVEGAGGNVVLHRPWSDGKLAYPIQNHRKGLHYVVYFHMPPRGMSEITRACKLSDHILRHLVIKQPKVLFDAMVSALSGAGQSDAGDEEDEE